MSEDTRILEALPTSEADALTAGEVSRRLGDDSRIERVRHRLTALAAARTICCKQKSKLSLQCLYWRNAA